MITPTYFKEQFDRLQSGPGANGLRPFREAAFQAFSNMGIPTARHEEWKYTRISSLFNKDYQLPAGHVDSLSTADLEALRLPGHESANELFFINGTYSASLSRIVSSSLAVLPLEEAFSGDSRQFVTEYLGHSSQYQK